MESYSPIGELMETVMSKLQQMVDVNTIVGKSVETQDGTVVLPISKVSFGFVAGGGEYEEKSRREENVKLPFAGGSGAGVSLQPVAFMVVAKDQIRLMTVNQNNIYDRIIDSVPNFIEKLSDTLKKDKDEEEEQDKEETVKEEVIKED